MYLTSLIHRDSLFRLANRWFTGQASPGDGHFLTEVFVFEQSIIAPAVLEVMRDVQQRVHPGPVNLRRIMFKDELREAIIKGCREPGGRIKSLFEEYLARPEEYFPRTPVDLILATNHDGTLAAMARFKSTRRIADKASRRIIDRLAGVIQSTAQQLARRRAEEAGIPLERFFSPPDVMAGDFINAERIVSRSFQEPCIELLPEDTHIDDVVGFKFAGPAELLETIEKAVAEHPKAVIAERETHQGEYNAINLLVDIQLPPPGIIIDGLRDQDWSFAVSRGLDPEDLHRDLPGYVESGARTIRVEVILTTFEELVESEFGRSMHEERIIKQRSSTPYRGRIAQNASYLIEYMLMLAISPRVEVAEIPIKMWGRYLPDTLSAEVWKLFGIEPVINPVFHHRRPAIMVPGEGMKLL